MSDKLKKVEAFIKEASPAHNELAEQRYTELRNRRGQELEHWHDWNNSGRPKEKLEPLLKSIDPIITSYTKKKLPGLGGSISAPALKNELRNTAVKAFETYDPQKSQLTTHVINNFMRATDFISANRNTKYMPRSDVEQYGTFQNAKTEFEELHGHPPTVSDLKEMLPSWSTKQIAKMQKGFSAEAFNYGEGLSGEETDEDPIQKIRGAFLLLKSRLNPQQVEFANLHYPEEGTKQMSVSAIAKAMKLPPHRVYRIKKQVEATLAPVVKRQ